MQSQHGGSLHGLDSLFTHLNWALEDKQGNQSFKNVMFFIIQNDEDCVP